jgi:xanthine dehydrogenase YagS FAD-binding subunit
VFLAGGTNLLDLMKGDVLQPAQVVDISRLPGLDGIAQAADGGWRIGALVRNADLARDAGFAAAFPAVAEALLSGASAQLRNAATAGGNILQRTRCPYFYDTASDCNKRVTGSGCSAIGGQSELTAILGASAQCVATHPSDFAVPLMAFDAAVEIAGAAGTRQVALVDFYRLPGETPAVETVLTPGELITAIIVPAAAAEFAAHARYVKVRERTSYAFAVVSAAAGLQIRDGVIVAARLALGGVAPKPWRVPAAEAALAGKPPERAQFRAAAEMLVAGATASGHNGWKIELAARTAVRALMLAAAGTPARKAALPASCFAMPDGVLIDA